MHIRKINSVLYERAWRAGPARAQIPDRKGLLLRVIFEMFFTVSLKFERVYTSSGISFNPLEENCNELMQKDT